MKNLPQNFGFNFREKVKEERQSFKSILMELQEIRDYYKLSITLQSRSPRIDKTKDRFLIRASRELENIEKKIENGMIDYGTENTHNRQKKLSNIV